MLRLVTLGALVFGFRAKAFSTHVRRICRRFCHRLPLTQLNSFRLIGGQYIGLMANFDSSTGKHISIDERYIPSSLLEWGYPPATLEVIVAETATPIVHDESGPKYGAPTLSDTHCPSSTLFNLARAIYTIMPATGCDVDNLETIHTKEEWNFSRVFCHRNEGKGLDMLSAISTISVVTSRVNAPPTIRVESCFAWTPSDGSRNQEQNAVYYRTRISFDLEYAHSNDNTKSIPNGWNFVRPIQVSLERPLSSSAEIIARTPRDGGLDGRTVANWLGPTLNGERMRNFPQDPSCENYSWIQHEPISTNEHHSISHDLFMAGNLTLSLRNSRKTNTKACDHSYQVDIGRITGRSDSVQDSPTHRHVISFHLPSPTCGTQTVETNLRDLVHSCMVTSRVELGTIQCI